MTRIDEENVLNVTECEKLKEEFTSQWIETELHMLYIIFVNKCSYF